METLYATEPSNQHLPLVLEKPDHWRILEGAINRRSLAKAWKPLKFRFHAGDGAANLTPTICSVYLPGVLAFRSEMRDVLFPSPCADLEFLPIKVGTESWLLLNCLKSTKDYDARRSVLVRAANDEIIMIQRIVVRDESVRACGVFTIADSNRGQLLVLASMRQRTVKSGAKGVEFREIGVLNSPAPERAK